MTAITTSADLNCAVSHTGDSAGEFFGDTACGTFVTDGAHLYGPATVPSGDSATSVASYTPWTPVSQSGPTGSGTQGNPYKIVTTVSGGPFTVTQTDSYVVGQESVRTDVQVRSSAAVHAIVYRAGDCYLQDSDVGLGGVDGGVAPTCRAEPTSTNPNRIEQWYPLTSGSSYLVDNYDTVWATIGAMKPFPDTVASGASGPYDNGAGLSWSKTFAAGEAANFAHLMLFSPAGIRPLTVSESVTPATTSPDGQVTYTILVRNSSSSAATLSNIQGTLPAGFGYVPGTTQGATSVEPAISGQVLTWTGSFTVPAGTSTAPGTLTLTFSSTTHTAPGTYTSSATVTAARSVTVVSALDVAPVVVSAAAVTRCATPNAAAPTASTLSPGTTAAGPTTTTAPSPSTATTLSHAVDGSEAPAFAAVTSSTPSTAMAPSSSTTALSTTAPSTTAPSTTAPSSTTTAGSATTAATATPCVTISSGIVAANGTITVSGTGWAPNSDVTIELHSRPVDLGTAHTDGLGRFAVEVSMPPNVAIGEHTLVLAGIGANGQPRSVSLPLEIVAAVTAASPAAPASPVAATPRFTG